MEPAVKWIGGASLAVVLVFATATVANYALNTEEEPTLKVEDVLDFDTASDVVETPSSDEGADPIEKPADAEDVAPSIAPDEPFVIKRILPITEPIKYGQWFWDDEDVPDGPLVMTVDLQARVISVFRGGYEIGAAAVLLGTDEHPTPLGRFPILTKEKDNVSEKYGNAPMPYTLRLTWDGVAIHGSQVENGYASHGCVGTPNDFAAKLFAIAKKGDVVIITDGVTTGVGNSLIAG